MSEQPFNPATVQTPIEQVITPEQHDLGGFSVHRSLPNDARQMVGPFIFLDHLGPAVFPPGKGVDVRPHPHINLATVTYLFEGSLLHRDSLGVVQEIVPGEVNWMTAGKGVVHSERSPDAFREKESTLHAVQTWVALPKEFEEVEPSFFHYDSNELPIWTEHGTTAVLIAGKFQQRTSPVQTYSPMLYLSLSFSPGGQFQLPESEGENTERALYSVTAGLSINGQPIEQHRLFIIAPDESVEISASEEARCIIVGGAPLGKREKYWNFVSSRSERIQQAKTDWQDKQFPDVPTETEFIPLPKAQTRDTSHTTPLS